MSVATEGTALSEMNPTCAALAQGTEDRASRLDWILDRAHACDCARRERCAVHDARV